MKISTIGGVLGLFVFGLGCGSKEPASSVGPAKMASLAKGTEVRLTLLRQIEAGGSREGLLVPFMVSEDVMDGEGNVLIAKGAIAEGEVAWSRSEGTLSGLVNQPARLSVKFTHTRAAGDETVKLCADKEKPDEPYAFTRENTGKPWERSDIQRMSPELSAAVARALSDFMETGDASKIQSDAQAREWLISISKEPGMEAARAYLDPDSPQKANSDELERVVRHVRDGTITQLAGGDVLLAVSALEQFGKLAQSVEHSISGKLKGRTIKAYIGTPATAYVAQDVTVKASPR